MNETEIRERLNRLAELRTHLDSFAFQKKALIDAVLTDEIVAQIANIEAEFAPRIEGVTASITEVEAEIRQAVIVHGASVKSIHYHAIFAKGRTSWDTKGLDGYAVAHPEILVMRKEGQPSVSIREVK